MQSLAILVIPVHKYNRRGRVELVAGDVCELLALMVHLVLAARVKLPRHIVQSSTAHTHYPQGKAHTVEQPVRYHRNTHQSTQTGDDSSFV